LILNPSATFAEKGTRGIGAVYSLDKTARDPHETEGHHYLYLGSSYGLSSRTNFWLYHSRVLGRYEDEHLQFSGVQIKQRVTRHVAVGALVQWGNQQGEQLFAAVRFPLYRARHNGSEEEHERARAALDFHLGILWARWRGEWEGEEWVPYAGLTWQPTGRWLFVTEIRERQRNFLKPSWLIAVQYQLHRQWQLVLGWYQSGLSDRPYLMLGIGAGIGITR